MQEKKKNILLQGALVLCVLGMLPLLGGVGTAFGLWEPMTGFRMTMNYMTVSMVCALVFLFILIYMMANNIKHTVVSGVVVLLVFGCGYYLGINKEPPDYSGVRGIHDVTTDMENVPQFKALLDAPGRRNSFEYPMETAERQKAKFPWVKPILSELSVADAYARALKVAGDLNWNVVGEDPTAGRFEATDYSKWFKFHDDIVVRVTATQSGSRVDVRSLTRVGGSDHGHGAIRVMKFIKGFDEA
ncbi:MAG: DUF1499 domain-containing protein [Emcibacteraceae bacterium]|nr:DUF1499 domain-containing protein [Emcibacteraceae bacterium]